MIVDGIALSARLLPTPVFRLGVQEKVDEEACINMCCRHVFTLYKVFMSSDQFVLLEFWISDCQCHLAPGRDKVEI